MARLLKRLTDHQEYEDLVMEIIQSTDPDAELQDCINAYLQPNPKFYLMMFQAVSKIRDAAILSNDEHQVSGIDNLEGKLLELESKLYEKNNIIQADLPDSILYDNILKEHLSDHMGINYDPQDWRSFQNYIEAIVRSNPKNLELPILTWCEKMLRSNLKKHIESCSNPINCPKNQSYDRRIQYITRLIEDATPIPSEPIPIQLEIQDSGLRLTDRKGARIDLIRVTNAMWELGFFRDSNGLIPTKLTVMKAVGVLLGIDLSDYDKDLSQAFQTKNPELNIKIFRDLEEVTKNKVLS